MIQDEPRDVDPVEQVEALTEVGCLGLWVVMHGFCAGLVALANCSAAPARLESEALFCCARHMYWSTFFSMKSRSGRGSWTWLSFSRKRIPSMFRGCNGGPF